MSEKQQVLATSKVLSNQTKYATHHSDNDHLVELFRSSKGELIFCHRDRSGSTEYGENVSIDGLTIKAPSDLVLGGPSIVLPPSPHSDPQEPDKLFLDVLGFMEDFVTWTPEFAVGAAAYVLASWVHECFQFMGYLQFIGPPSSGKTRSVDVLNQLCYHAALMNCPTSAILYRVIQAYHPTLIIDEMDADSGSVFRDILRSGTSRDGCVWRCKGDNHNYKAESFSCYGPKVYAGQHPIKDAALLTRLITENMSRVTPANHIPDTLPAAFYERGRELQSRLLRLKIDKFWSISERLPSLPDRRQRQVFIPLFTVAPEAFYPDLIKLAGRQLKSSQIAMRDTDDGEVVAALKEMRAPEQIRPIEVAKTVCAMRDLRYEETRHPDWMSAKTAGLILKRLGFEESTRDRAGAIYFATTDQFEALFSRYLPEEEDGPANN